MKGNLYRTHNCGELRVSDVGSDVLLSGWVFRMRDHGGVLFIDLRDHYGVTQIVFDERLRVVASDISMESVVTISGLVRSRPADSINSKLATGDIEVLAGEIKVESQSDPIPLQVASASDYSEDIRLKYRYLDLRRESVRETIILRSRVAEFVRQKMASMGFIEVHTPLLTGSSPEGARDFLVPSRLHRGKFYALPQAPQLFKQLLMLSSFDKYFQIAPCFRDEDSRADRSPGEFYQIDMEMSFVTQEDVFSVAEELFVSLFTEFSSAKITSSPFPRITYAESMRRYGSDKPDLRNPLFAVDVTEIFADCEFMLFRNNIARGLSVRALAVDDIAGKPRKFFDDLLTYSTKVLGAGGLAYITLDSEGNAKGPIAKFLSTVQLEMLRGACSIKNNGGVFFFSDQREKADAQINGIRKALGEQLGLIDSEKFEFCWIVDFPMYEADVKTGELQFMHNPFSMPQGGIDALNSKNPLEILAYQYDIVCNGIELSSGAIRNHKIDWLYKAFEIAGYDKSKVDASFPALTSAFRYGSPPHGGIAPGFDRTLMLLAGKPNIREVTCFPLNQQGEDLMMGAPSIPDERHLTELGLKIVHKK